MGGVRGPGCGGPLAVAHVPRATGGPLSHGWPVEGARVRDRPQNGPLTHSSRNCRS